MEFRILGPLEVRAETGAVELGGSKPRAVLAMLLLHPNEPVYVERLALGLWGEDAPSTAVKTVQVYVSRLRKALGDPDALTTTLAGYRLRVRPGELDAERFADLVDDGRRALDAGRAEHAATLLREALGLWRGPPLADFAFAPFARAEIARLEEQRLAALEARVAADLAAGRHEALVGELRQLVAAHPTRERLAGQLMVALYRCGRQADALEAFQAARRLLIAELGVEPGPELRSLEVAILRHDGSLAPRSAPCELPPELDGAGAPPLLGRDAELAWLRERWERARTAPGAVIALTGPRGIGKRRLAAELAGETHRLGAVVEFCSGRGPSEPVRAALARAREVSQATLLVVDAVDEAGADLRRELTSLAPLGAPVLVLALAEALDGDDELALKPLDEDAARAIAALYAIGDELPDGALLATSDGVPGAIHALAARWARSAAARRVGAVAERTAAGRADLRSMESELSGTVVELQAAHERVATSGRDEPHVVCPFKGLASFDVADAAYFFGRERLVAELVARLVGAPLLGVVGPSGSGKSSVVRAGLLSALSSGVLPGSEGWRQTVIRPGEHPLRELDRAVDGVLVVDQFEEAFTACHGEGERAAFVDALADFPRERGVVVVAVRADYYGRCAAYPQLAALLAANHVLVGAMRRDELRRAVECPAQRGGLAVEPELADALVADVEGQVGGLPLLSAALLGLWQHRDGRHLRHSAYLHGGGVRGAVAQLAEDAYRRLDDGRRAVARDVVMRLVGLSEDGAVERRRVPLSAFAGEDVTDVLELFTDRRLLTVSAATVEVAHEALLREWPRLRGWIDEDREGLRIHRSLTSAALEWDRLDRDAGALYRGVRLVEAAQWSAHATVSELERAFVAASQSAGVRERSSGRRRRRLTGVAIALASAAVVAIVVTALFASRERDLAASRDLATTSSSLLATDPPLALAISLEALRRRRTAQAEVAVRQATLTHRATRVVDAHRGLVFGVSASPDGRLVATAGGDRTVRLWSVESGRRVGEIRGFSDEVRALAFSRDARRLASVAHDGEIAVARVNGGPRAVVARLAGDFATSVDFGSDGTTLAIGTYGGRVALVRTGDGAVRELQPGGGAPVFAAAFDGAARRVVSAGADGLATIFDVAGGRRVDLVHPGTDAAVLAASFSPDGALVATGSSAGAVRLWNARTGEKVGGIQVSDEPLASVRFSGDGQRILIGTFSGALYLAAVREGAVLAELRGHKGPARAEFVPRSERLVSAGEEDGTMRIWAPLAIRLVSTRAGAVPLYSPDGAQIVSGDEAGPIHLWSSATGAERILRGHDDTSHPRFSPDGRRIVSASSDGRVLMWDLRDGRARPVPVLPGDKYAATIDAGGERIAVGGATPLVIQAPDGTHRVKLRGHRGYVNALAFSGASAHLLTGSDDATARVWNARDGALERTLRGHEGIIRDVAYSEDGRQIATAGSDGTVRVWPADGGSATILVGHEGPVNSAAFNRRGDRLVSAGDDGTIRVWDTVAHAALVVLHRHNGSASGASFSPDGRDVVSAGDDGVRITPCEVCGSLEQVLRVARVRAQHRLSDAERQRLVPDD